LGIAELDRLVISHADIDHAGGALAIQRGLAVRDVVSGEAVELPVELAARDCATGDGWQWNEVRFSVWRWPHAQDGNQASCVLLVEAQGERLLLTGDIDAAAESALLATGMDVQAHWLLVAHHGSRSSSTAALLDAVQADAALISRGRHNTFGHPHPQVLELLRAAGSVIHDTAEEGALRLQLGAFAPAAGLRAERRVWREKEERSSAP